MVVWQNPAFRGVGLLQAQGSELDKYQTLLRNPVTWNVTEVLVTQKSLTFHRSSLVWMTVYKRMKEEQQVSLRNPSPTLVDPVKAILSMLSWVEIAAPAVGP